MGGRADPSTNLLTCAAEAPTSLPASAAALDLCFYVDRAGLKLPILSMYALTALNLSDHDKCRRLFLPDISSRL